MAQEFLLPKLGDSITEVDLLEWHVKVGDKVEKDQIVGVVETAKTSVEIPCPFAGTVIALGANPGDTIPVGDMVMVIGEEGETYEGASAAAPAAAEAASAEKAAPAAEAKTSTAVAGDVRAMPKARKLARELGVALDEVVATGPNGRITTDDVQNAAAAPAGAEAAADTPEMARVRRLADKLGVDLGQFAPEGAAPAAPAAAGSSITGQSFPLTGMRKAMADAMHGAMSSTAQMTAATEVDMSKMMALRKRMVEMADQLGAKVSITDLLIAAAARAVKASPLVNASIVDNEIVVHEDVNIGLALSLAQNNTDTSLVVPVIRNADQKSVVQINQEIRELAEKGMKGQLGMEDMTGATFTFSSTSALFKRWMVHTPIVPPGNSALVGTNAIVDRPVVVDGEIVVRPIMPFVISWDHRIMDGRLPGLYMNALCDLLEDPDSIWYL